MNRPDLLNRGIELTAFIQYEYTKSDQDFIQQINNISVTTNRFTALQDITTWLQQTVTESSSKTSNDFASVEIPKGDYALLSLQIPKNKRVVLFSGDKVRLLFAGKRNRPMFVLDENSILVLREKIEIYYNTNNLQDVSKLMIRYPKSARVEISKDVKISLFSMKSQE
ncbi:MAG TPA: hypothetical protein VN739_04760 [Nitrososphaerales archaeon]|nr:hypothetical protein [Nitrososphaerales archaeon]